MTPSRALLAICLLALAGTPARAQSYSVTESPDAIDLKTNALQASIRKQGYVSGVAGGSLVDLKTGFHDAGFGLDIIDWIMEPGSDSAYRSQLTGDLPYDIGNLVHGNIQKRTVEGPQICTKAQQVTPHVIRGKDFVAVQTSWQYTTAAPGKNTGTTWTQNLVFPVGERWFISSDSMLSANEGDALFFRQDMPGHIKHTKGDTFSEIYLSYFGKIPASEFLSDFAPDQKFLYQRTPAGNPPPQRMIRAYHLRDPKTGADGPWLAGMTLNPADVYEAWCHQRGYVCFIQEIGGRPVKRGDSFGAAYIVGYFDTIPEMEKVYDQYSGHSALAVSENGWHLQ